MGLPPCVCCIWSDQLREEVAVDSGKRLSLGKRCDGHAVACDLNRLPTRDLSYIPGARGFLLHPIKKELEELGNRMIDPELLKDVLVQVGSAFEVITNIARDYEVDLIVLTTHGKIGLKHVFVGSTAERVVRHAPCPVLVVRKHEQEFV